MTDPTPTAPDDRPSAAAPPESDPQTETGAPTPAKPKRKRRVPLWAKIAFGFVLLICILVLLAPTIASTGVARSFVLGKVNENLTGKVEIDNWSLGWKSGFSASGVRVRDAAGDSILQLNSLTTGLTVLDAVRGRYDLGEVVIDGLDVKVRRDADGQLNFSKLAKAESPAPADRPSSGSGGSHGGGARSSKLPNISGKIVLRNARASYTDVAKGQSVDFPTIDGSVNIPNINAPIENTLNVVAVSQSGQRGTLKVSGKIDAIEDNALRVESADVDERIEVGGIEGSAIAPLFPPGTVDKLAGLTNATLSLKTTGGKSAQLQAQLTSTDFAVSGPALSGDTLSGKELSVVIPPTTVDMSSGFGGWMNWPIRVGGERALPIAITLEHNGYADTVTIGATDVTAQSLSNVGANMQPGAAGDVELSVDVTLGGLAKQLPHVFAEQDGKRLASGKLALRTRVKLQPDSSDVAQSLDLTDLSLEKAGSKDVERLQPIKQSLAFTSHGGGWAMPDLRDVKASLASSFAQAQFGGAQLSQLSGKADGDLAKMQRELGQIIPMGDMQLAGRFNVALSTSGEVTKTSAPLTVSLQAAVKGLVVEGVCGCERYEQGLMQLAAAAKIVRDEAGNVQALQGVSVTAKSGADAANLTLDSELTADVTYGDVAQTNPATGKPETVRVASVPRYNIERLSVSLPRLQREFPEQTKALADQGLRFDGGTLSVSGGGSYSQITLSFALRGAVSGVNLVCTPTPAATASATLAPVPPAAAATTVLRDYTLTFEAAGTNESEGASAGTRFSTLRVSDNQAMVSLAGTGVTLPAAERDARPSGEIAIGDLDVKKLLDVWRAMSGAPRPQPGDPELQAAHLAGNLALADAGGPAKLMSLTGRLNLTGVSVKTPGDPIRDERLSVIPKIRVSRDFSLMNLDQVAIEGRLINGKVLDTVIDTNAGNAANALPLAAIKKASAEFNLPALGDLHALILALSPPAPTPAPAPAVAPKPSQNKRPAPPPAVAADAKPKPTGRILGGSAKVKFALIHQGADVVITPEITAKSLVIGAGDVSKPVGDVVLRTNARLVAAENAPADATFMQRLREISVPNLTLTGAGADIKLDQPLQITDLSAEKVSMAAALSGQIKLGELLPTLEAWSGEKPGAMYPYAGDMALQETVATKQGVMSIVGRADINDFAIADAAPANGKSRSTRFAERHIGFANNLSFDPAADTLKINDVSFAMETTKAARVVLNGTIAQLSTTRQLQNVVLNLDHNTAPLWDILRPLLDPETNGQSLAEIVMEGRRVDRIIIGGSYPADDPNAIRFVDASGTFAIDKLAVRGLTIEKPGLDLRFTLKKGILKLEHVTPAPPGTGLPPAANCNGPKGFLTLHGATVDLTGEHPRLTFPENHPLVRGVSLNPVFADSVIGRFVNPVFAGATQAQGILNVTVKNCRGLALDRAMQSPTSTDSGHAELSYGVNDLFFGQPDLVAAVSKVAPRALSQNGFAGSIADGNTIIDSGKAKSLMTLNIDKFHFDCDGVISIGEGPQNSYTVKLPKALFEAINRDFGRHAREQYPITVTGSMENLIPTMLQQFLPILADLGVRAGIGSVLDRAIGGNKSKPDRNVNPGEEQQQPSNPIDDLIRGIGGADKEKKKDPKPKQQERPRQAPEKPAPAAKPAPAPTRATTQPAATTQPDESKLSKKERERLKKEREREKKKQSK